MSSLAALGVLTVLGAWASAVDVREHRLPDSLTLPMAGLSIALAVVSSAQEQSLMPLLQVLTGMVSVFVIMAVLVVAGSGIGGGDLKFAAAAAAPVALVGGAAAALGGLALGLLLVAVAAVLAQRRGHTAIPYGPGLWLGALITAAVSSIV